MHDSLTSAVPPRAGGGSSVEAHRRGRSGPPEAPATTVAVSGPEWKARTALRERNRKALLRAAEELVAEHGYSGTSTAAIAARAGVTTGALYSIFGSKLQLFIEVLGPDWQAPGIEHLVHDGADLGDVLAAYGR